MTNNQLTPKEEQILTLYIVKSCIKYAEENGKSFRDVLTEEIFIKSACSSLSQMICKNLVILKNNGFIDGTIDIQYNFEIDPKTLKEETSEEIYLDFCIFKDIVITSRGKVEMQLDRLQDGAKEFLKKVKPILKEAVASSPGIILEIFIQMALEALIRKYGLS